MREAEYSPKLKSEETGKVLEFRSADGIPSKNKFTDEELLIADKARPEGTTLFWRPGFGALPVILSQEREIEAVAAGRSARAIELAERNLENNERSNTDTRTAARPQELEGTFKNAVYTPRAYSPVELVKKEILELLQLLENGGKLYIAGKKKTGLKRYRNLLKDQEGETRKKTSKGKTRLYIHEKQGEVESNFEEVEKNFKASLGDFEADFVTCEGLFSSGKLDEGSEILIENLEAEEDEKALDLACGYGAVGLYLRNVFSPDVTLSDDDLLALRYAERNFEENDTEASGFIHCDCLEEFSAESFDLIVSNPPTHQGGSITDEMFQESYKALKPGGRFVIVYNRNMDFRDQLDQIFDSTEVLEDRDNFRVLKASKSF